MNRAIPMTGRLHWAKRGRVKRLRSILAGHRQAMALMLALTLAVRLLVPAGFMPSFDHGRAELALCSGTVPVPEKSLAMAHHGDHHAVPAMADSHDRHGKAELPCAFTDLALASLQTPDAPAIVPPEAAALPPTAPSLLSLTEPVPDRLRPPSRAPPAIA